MFYQTILLLTLAVSVKDTATLRNGCGADDDAIVTLAPGEPLTVRFRLAGESSPCYKVSAQADGKAVEGYLPADAIAGLDEFEKGVRDASWVDVSQAVAAIRTSSVQMPSLTPGAGPGIAAGRVAPDRSQPAAESPGADRAGTPQETRPGPIGIGRRGIVARGRQPEGARILARIAQHEPESRHRADCTNGWSVKRKAIRARTG